METIESQPVLGPLSSAAVFLVLTIRDGGESVVHELLQDLSGLQRAVGFRDESAELSLVTGIGAHAWTRLFTGPKPRKLAPFKPVTGDPHSAPSTPGDLLFHIRAWRFDLCFELAAKIMGRLGNCVDVVDEVHGFRYFDARDLLGFVDGTENPTGNGAAIAAIVGGEDPGFTGGSYVTVQKYLHDLDAWNAIPVEQQERIIGRTKLENIEIDAPGPSHVTLNTITTEDGVEHKIVRDNMPFGTIGTREFGTYFIGYSANPDIIDEMLRHMFVGDPPGTYDRILDVSTAVTGSLFAVPPVSFLDDPPPQPN